MHPPAGFYNKWKLQCVKQQANVYLVKFGLRLLRKTECPVILEPFTHTIIFKQLKKVDVIVLSHS